MPKYTILCVDDDREVLEAVQTDLEGFKSHFDIEAAESVEEACSLIKELRSENREIALILCDHIMPGQTGVDFLIELNRQDETRYIRKILLTGEADLEATVKAVNNANLDYYLAKPWDAKDLSAIVSDQLTTYMIYHGDNALQFVNVLNQERLVDAHVEKQIKKFRTGFLNTASFSDKELSAKILDDLCEYLKTIGQTEACKTYGAGHILTREGEKNNRIWFLSKGEVVLTKKNTDGVDLEVLREKEGALIGLMSFISRHKAFVTTKTVTPVEVIQLDTKNLSRIMKENTEFLSLFNNLLSRHLNRRLMYSITTELKLQETLKSLDKAHTRIIESEKMAVLGQLISGVAHELNNPVAAIVRGIENVAEKVPEILSADTAPTVKAFGVEVLENAMRAKPIATAEIRRRTKNTQRLFKSHSIAKKAVRLNLDSKEKVKKLLHGLGEKEEEVIEQLDQYYQVGSFLRSIDVCSKRIANMVKGLKEYSRPDNKVLQKVNILIGIEDTLVLFENKLKHYEVIKEYETLPDVECYPIELQQVWTNMVSNAIDATQGKGTLIITARPGKKIDGINTVEITFEDDGSGISPEIREKIFEINFTTKSKGDFGLGIGLAICQQIINHHNGTIHVESEVDRFTRFVITLPVSTRKIQGDNHE